MLTYSDLDAYTFLLEPNREWSKFYLPEAEIHVYIKRTVSKYKLDKHMQINTRLVEASWDDDMRKWKVKTDVGGSITEDEVDILVNGFGFLKYTVMLFPKLRVLILSSK